VDRSGDAERTAREELEAAIIRLEERLSTQEGEMRAVRESSNAVSIH